MTPAYYQAPAQMPQQMPQQMPFYGSPVPPPVQNRPDPGVEVDISPQARAAYARGVGAENSAEAARSIAAASPTQCATCESRTYQDVSDDPSVSFQTPTHISPGQSAAAVASHEAEHVANEQAKADREGYEIVSQTVTLHSSICPECKRVYVSGGTTRTLSRQGGQEEAQAPEEV